MSIPALPADYAFVSKNIFNRQFEDSDVKGKYSEDLFEKAVRNSDAFVSQVYILEAVRNNINCRSNGVDFILINVLNRNNIWYEVKGGVIGYGNICIELAGLMDKNLKDVFLDGWLYTCKADRIVFVDDNWWIEADWQKLKPWILERLVEPRPDYFSEDMFADNKINGTNGKSKFFVLDLDYLVDSEVDTNWLLAYKRKKIKEEHKFVLK